MMKIRLLERTVDPLMVSERPYESFCLNHTNVVRDGDVWHMWYMAYDHTYDDDGSGYFCYARSDDGVHWERPDLGLVEFGGNRDNNILHDSRNQRRTLGEYVFIDRYAPPEERFKMTLHRKVSPSPWLQSARDRLEFAWQIFGAVSGDGIHWRLLDEPLFKYNSDTQTAIIREEDRYRMYVRMWGTRHGSLYCRSVGYTESDHFGDFPGPVEILRSDDADPDKMDFYTSAATKLDDDLYVLIPCAFYQAEGKIRPHFAAGSDGVLFRRVGREPIFDVGPGFDSWCIYVSPGAIPGPRPNTWWFYYLGTNVGHDVNDPGRVKKAGGFGRFLVEISPDEETAP